MTQVFIDGREGTTGLEICERLEKRADVALLAIDPALRKDREAKRKIINQADVAILCLPDAAAREAVALVENPSLVVLDASTAHRTQPGWAYGFPELSAEQRQAVAASKRIAVPGCHATGFIAAVYPLIAHGVIAPDTPLCCHSITGYSGGGKKMIADYQSPIRPREYESPRQYALSLQHKHLPEMTQWAGLTTPPLFNPIVCDFYSGMAVSVPLHIRQCKKPMTRDALEALYQSHYEGRRFVSVRSAPADGFLPAGHLAGTNDLALYVCGNDQQFTIISVFDNLGKGASGAAMQCMNIALGLPEDTGF